MAKVKKTSSVTMEKKRIKEIILVEGRDDTAAIQRAVEAVTIETHGFGFKENPHFWSELKKAQEDSGIIIFTDPDYAGNLIRKEIKARFPNCKEAFLSKDEANNKGNIGVENAKEEAIINALTIAKASYNKARNSFTWEDILKAGLVGRENSKARREKLCRKLGIGYGNGKALLKKLNVFAIDRKVFEEEIKKL